MSTCVAECGAANATQIAVEAIICVGYSGLESKVVRRVSGVVEGARCVEALFIQIVFTVVAGVVGRGCYFLLAGIAVEACVVPYFCRCQAVLVAEMIHVIIRHYLFFFFVWL